MEKRSLITGIAAFPGGGIALLTYIHKQIFYAYEFNVTNQEYKVRGVVNMNNIESVVKCA